MTCSICEALESRTLLTGSVSASVSDGVLLLRGDTFANELTIDTEGLPAGSVRVEGFQTLLNGQQSPLVFAGVTGTVLVSLGAGDDQVVISNASLPADLRIAMGKGNDSVLMHSVDVGGGLLVRTKSGADSVGLMNTTIAGGTRVSTGSSRDVLTVDSSTFNGKVLLKTRGGRDSIGINASSFNARTRVKAGYSGDLITRSLTTISYDFRNGDEGWQAGFADYNSNANEFDENGDPLWGSAEEYFQLDSGVRPTPAELGEAGTGFLLSGDNRSADLFMFLKRRLGAGDGVSAGQKYQAIFALTLASNSPTGCGAGEDVFLKAGAGPDEPNRVLDANNDWRMSVDKGNQANSGPAASLAGHIANGITCEDRTDPPQFKSFSRPHVHTIPVVPNGSGDLWLLVGTDSGSEGPSFVYYQQIDVKLVPVL